MNDEAWQRLVALSSTLQSSLSLRQLVPVQYALIQAVISDGSRENYQTESIDDHFAHFVSLTDPTVQLLKVQYLLYNIEGTNRLTGILLPLLQRQNLNSPIWNNDELREAFLDAAFAGLVVTDDATTMTTMEKCLLRGLQDLPKVWMCRILVRLFPICPLLNLIVHHIVEGMATGTCETLRPITTWLVPLLCQATSEEKLSQESSQTLNRVWSACLEVIAMVMKKDGADLEKALMASSVLCALLPHVANIKWEATQVLNTVVRPVEEQILWTFISYLLHRGSQLSVKGGSFQYEDNANNQCLRRRGLYLLRVLIESLPAKVQRENVWVKYIMCFETMEMEQEQHLIDQVWDMVTEVCLEAWTNTMNASIPDFPPPMTWDWIAAMLCRLFLSETPVLRKLVLFRFFNGRAGIRVDLENINRTPVDERRLALQRPPKKKHAIKSKQHAVSGAPMTLVSTAFVLDVVIPSFDTLAASIGTNMNYEERGKIMVQDIAPKAIDFIKAFTRCLDETRLQTFIAGVLDANTLLCLRPKTTVQILTAIAESVNTDGFSIRVLLTKDLLAAAVSSFQQLFGSGSIVITYRHGLLSGFATILAVSTIQESIPPLVILRVLTLFPLDLVQSDTVDRLDHIPYKALKQWLANLGGSDDWAATTSAACAAAFVQSELVPGLSSGETWDPVLTATSDNERAIGAAIVLLATLSGTSAASSLLWPAIHKGLQMIPSAELNWINAHKASRALLLLENGCTLKVLSGLGNGDLVVQRDTQTMMPPPPNIEALLTNAVGFLLNHVRSLSTLHISLSDSFVSDSKLFGGSTCTGSTHRASTAFAHIVAQLKILAESYPSSMAVSSASEQLLEIGVKQMMLLRDADSKDVVSCTCLTYAALSCGADPWFSFDGISSPDVCSKLLKLEFNGTGNSAVKQEEQTARSIFHYARWGCLSFMIPKLLQKPSDVYLTPLLEQIFSRAVELAEATPLDALLPLFDTVRSAAASWLELPHEQESYSVHLEKIIAALFAALSDVSVSSTATYMLNGICALLFRPSVLHDEYQRLQQNPNYEAPVHAAFLHIMKIAGCLRSHYLKAALCHICAGWLGSDGHQSPGLGAIPYADEVVRIVVLKELKLDESSTNQSILSRSDQGNEEALRLPVDTNSSSIARGFILAFFSRLPGPDDGLDPRVLKDFLHKVILTLLRNVCFTPLKSGSTLMTGTEDYSMRIRSWQALCVLSRFVSNDIADEACDRLFETLNQNLHGEIRYFMEMFAIQCSRKHPQVFGKRLVIEIQRTDLSLQQVSSLMILAGNLIVGKYNSDFFSQFKTSQSDNMALHEILSGVIPWLSSTQGFSRAIAQLLVYDLIPLVIDIKAESKSSHQNDWYLLNLYRFLDQNSEMKRLRDKQLKAFDRYDADYTCTVEGILSTKVDESDEADPVHIIELVKKCLEDVYLEAHEHDAPQWKQVEQMLLVQPTQQEAGHDGDMVATFQRKIIPLDALDLAVGESREERLRNASGRKRQSLVICASLIDKIPNLGGLARTAEIFAADRLVIPDMNVVRMDNFKSISVGAGDWIQIEECKEDKLLTWLRAKQEHGYSIVGLEQTSSSESIENFSFPEKTVLLLGKEKEGIPVEILQVVDYCVEIPQFGIIRSLNVHVSGAICIWEYSKQLLSRT